MDNYVRITVVGDARTGKTSLLIKYKNGNSNLADYTPVIFDPYSIQYPIGKKIYTVILRETASEESFETLRYLADKDTDVFIVCYSVDNIKSWVNVREIWAPELKERFPKAKLVLTGTKCDLEHRQVSLDDGKRLSKEIKAERFIENSAKSGTNIDDTFYLAIKTGVKTRKKSCAVI